MRFREPLPGLSARCEYPHPHRAAPGRDRPARIWRTVHARRVDNSCRTIRMALGERGRSTRSTPLHSSSASVLVAPVCNERTGGPDAGHTPDRGAPSRSGHCSAGPVHSQHSPRLGPCSSAHRCLRRPYRRTAGGWFRDGRRRHSGAPALDSTCRREPGQTVWSGSLPSVRTHRIGPVGVRSSCGREGHPGSAGPPSRVGRIGSTVHASTDPGRDIGSRWAQPPWRRRPVGCAHSERTLWHSHVQNTLRRSGLPP